MNYKSMWKGLVVGALGGFVTAVLMYLYFQITHPNPYNVFVVIYYGPIFSIFGAMIGVLIAAWRES